MAKRQASKQRRDLGNAPLNLLRAAFCPLEFQAMPLSDHPEYQQFTRDKTLKTLIVGAPLHHTSSFRYKDLQGNYKFATQSITAPFGLAPRDFEVLLGLLTYWRKLEEKPAERSLDLTTSFIARLAHHPVTSTKDLLRERSRVFRLAHVQMTSTGYWNPHTESWDNISNFPFFSIRSMSQLVTSRQPVTLELSSRFIEIAEHWNVSLFDWSELLAFKGDADRRFYLLANQLGYRHRHSPLFNAEDFVVEQLGYAPNRQWRHKLEALIGRMEERGVIRPYSGWGDYFTTPERGFYKGQLAIRWDRGPLIATKEAAAESSSDSLQDDPLWEQIQHLRNDEDKPVAPAIYRHWLKEHGRDKMQKHIRIVIKQIECRPRTIRRSSVATFVDRLRKDYANPPWYDDVANENQLSIFAEIQPSDTCRKLYDEAFRQ